MQFCSNIISRLNSILVDQIIPGDEKNEKKKILLDFKRSIFFSCLISLRDYISDKNTRKISFFKIKTKMINFQIKRIQYRLPTAAMNTNRKKTNGIGIT